MSDEFVAEVKQCVADPATAPRLNDLLNSEAGRLIDLLRTDEFELATAVSDEGVTHRLDRYAAVTGDLARAFSLGARWSGDVARPLWRSVLGRVVEGVDRARGETTWADLSLYPGALLLYAAGVGALAGDRYDSLRAILVDPRLRHRNEWRFAIEVINAHTVMDPRQAARVAGLPDTFAPISDRLAADLRPLVVDLVPDDAAFDRLFDRFEYLLGLVYLDATRTGDSGWGPTGRFGAAQYGTGIDPLIEAEMTEAGESWGPLAVGLFRGSSARLEESLGLWRGHLEAVRREARFSHLR